MRSKLSNTFTPGCFKISSEKLVVLILQNFLPLHRLIVFQLGAMISGSRWLFDLNISLTLLPALNFS
jgi:hypothetical protein